MMDRTLAERVVEGANVLMQSGLKYNDAYTMAHSHIQIAALERIADALEGQNKRQAGEFRKSFTSDANSYPKSVGTSSMFGVGKLRSEARIRSERNDERWYASQQMRFIDEILGNTDPVDVSDDFKFTDTFDRFMIFANEHNPGNIRPVEIAEALYYTMNQSR